MWHNIVMNGDVTSQKSRMICALIFVLHPLKVWIEKLFDVSVHKVNLSHEYMLVKVKKEIGHNATFVCPHVNHVNNVLIYVDPLCSITVDMCSGFSNVLPTTDDGVFDIFPHSSIFQLSHIAPDFDIKQSL